MSETDQIVEELQRVVIKEELMALVETYYGNKQGIHMRAAYLNNLIFWQGIQLKSDLKAKTKIKRAIQNKISSARIEKMKSELRNGWFYKTSEEHQIELMGFCSGSSITRMNKEFQEQGWAEIGKNPDPKKKWDKATWYKLDLVKINEDLNLLGFHLEGFKFSEGKAEQTAPDSNFHGEKSNFHGEKSNFHGEKSNFHDENSNFHDGKAIPEGISEGLSESDSIKKEKEASSSILDNPSLNLLKELAIQSGFNEDLAMELVNYVNDIGIKTLNETIIMDSFALVQEDDEKGIIRGNFAKWTAGKIKIVANKPKLSVRQSNNGAKPNKSRKQPVREEIVQPWLQKDQKEMDPSDEAFESLKTLFKNENPDMVDSEFSVWMDQKYKEYGIAEMDYISLETALIDAQKKSLAAKWENWKAKQPVSF